MNKQTFTQKQTGDRLSAAEWNNLTSYVNEVVDEVSNNSGSEQEENLVNSVLQPSANEEKNILELHLNGYYTFDLTYTLAGNLQNPVTQEQIDTFRSQNDNIQVNSFNIGYLELSVIQGIMNERSVITSKDIRDLSNSTTYERQSGQTSLTNLTYELDGLPNQRFFELVCSDGILLGQKISGDIIFNNREFGTTKLSDILSVTWNLLPTIRKGYDIPSIAHMIVVPVACYVFPKSSPEYVTIYGETITLDATLPEPEPEQPSAPSVGTITPSPTATTYAKYLNIKYIGANSLNSGGTCKYIYSTDIEKFFNISVPDGAYTSAHQAQLDFLANLWNNGQADFTYDNTEYTIIISSDTIDDIVIRSPNYAGNLGGKPSNDVKLSDLITIVNQMKNQTGPWAA